MRLFFLINILNILFFQIGIAQKEVSSLFLNDCVPDSIVQTFYLNQALSDSFIVFKEFNIQDNNGYITKNVRQKFQFNGDTTENKMTSFVYNSTNQAALRVRNYSLPNVFLDSMFYFYGQNGLLDSTIRYSYHQIFSSPTSVAKTQYRYNATGKIIEQIIFDLLNNAWRPISKNEITYSSTEKEKKRQVYSWLNNSWVLSEEEMRVYDNQDSLIRHITSYSNPVFSAIVDYEYINQGQLLLEQRSLVDQFGEIDTIYRDSVLFDINGYEMENYRYAFSLNTSSLVKTFYEPIENCVQYKDYYSGFGLDLTNVSYSARMRYYYSDNTSSTLKPLKSNDIRLFPNITSSTFKIGGVHGQADIRIYDTFGKNCFSGRYSQNEIDITHFQNGLYLVEITNNAQKSILKLIKQ